MINLLFGISITINIVLIVGIILYLKFKLMTKKELGNLKELLSNDTKAVEDLDCFLDFFHKN